jgi:hypothetical protein
MCPSARDPPPAVYSQTGLSGIPWHDEKAISTKLWLAVVQPRTKTKSVHPAGRVGEADTPPATRSTPQDNRLIVVKQA